MPMTPYPQAKKLFYLLLLCWLIINLIQSVFTEINSDEAYYFMYGRYLSFGYFDHPPLVGVLTHLSSYFFEGNLGVRFITVLLQAGTLMLVWLQLDEPGYSKEKVMRFYVVAGSIVMFVVYGFITTPDVPLLFFTALFLYWFKKFFTNQNWTHALLLAISMAGLVYSKYQGMLVIAFTLLSNPKLLKNKKFIAAIFLAIILFIPHLWWQYVHGFPSFEYQLIERSSPFKWKYLFEYIFNQFLVFNPFTFTLVLYLLIKTRPRDKMERLHYFIIAGFLLAFWITTFRGHAEPHWTIAAAIPMIILLVNRISTDPQLKKYTYRVIAPSLILVLIGRIAIATDLLPPKLGFHGKEKIIRTIEKFAKDTPVVFTASYREPSLYTFFTGKPATVISNLESRKTQYDLWNFEEDLCNKPVFVHVNFPHKSITYHEGTQHVNGLFTQHFIPFNRLKIQFNLPGDAFKPGDRITIAYRIDNNTKCDINFADTVFVPGLYVVLHDKSRMFKVKTEQVNPIRIVQSSNVINSTANLTIPQEIPAGKYQIGMSVYSILGLSFNSDFTKKIKIGK